MNPPSLLRFLPATLRTYAVKYWYARRLEAWMPLYTHKELELAPGVFMDGLVPGDRISNQIAFTGRWGGHFGEVVLAKGREGGLMVDVGANLGYFSLLWAAAKSGNRVVAVEASPRNHPLLQRNIEGNAMQDRIRMLGCAVGREKGKLSFALGSEIETGWGGFTTRTDEKSVEVDVERLDELLADEPVIDLMKVDIEGADTWAIQGCEALLKAKRVKELWFEENKPRMKRLGIERAEVMDFLAGCGYDVQPMSSPRFFQTVEWRARPR